MKQETNPRISPHPPRPNSSLRDGLHFRPPRPFLPRRFAARPCPNSKFLSAVSCCTSLELILAPTHDRALLARGGLVLHLTIRASGNTESHPRLDKLGVAVLCPALISILVFLAGGIQKRNGRQEAGAALILKQDTQVSDRWLDFLWYDYFMSSRRLLLGFVGILLILYGVGNIVFIDFIRENVSFSVRLILPYFLYGSFILGVFLLVLSFFRRTKGLFVILAIINSLVLLVAGFMLGFGFMTPDISPLEVLLIFVGYIVLLTGFITGWWIAIKSPVPLYVKFLTALPYVLWVFFAIYMTFIYPLLPNKINPEQLSNTPPFKEASPDSGGKFLACQSLTLRHMGLPSDLVLQVTDDGAISLRSMINRPNVNGQTIAHIKNEHIVFVSKEINNALQILASCEDANGKTLFNKYMFEDPKTATLRDYYSGAVAE